MQQETTNGHRAPAVPAVSKIDQDVTGSMEYAVLSIYCG